MCWSRWECAVLVTRSCHECWAGGLKGKGFRGQIPDVPLAGAGKQIINFRFSVLKNLRVSSLCVSNGKIGTFQIQMIDVIAMYNCIRLIYTHIYVYVYVQTVQKFSAF